MELWLLVLGVGAVVYLWSEHQKEIDRAYYREWFRKRAEESLKKYLEEERNRRGQ